jgi:choline monooxygenase
LIKKLRSARIQTQQAAYMETCAEDDEVALRMEDGMQHFHEWYRREMGASKTTQMI